MLLQQLRHYFETDVIGYGYIELESNKAIKILNFPTLSNLYPPSFSKIDSRRYIER